MTDLNRWAFRQPSPILDFAWYPAATSRDAASFCFVASVRECPVKLLDASDGRVRALFVTFSLLVDTSIWLRIQLRASYKIVDHRERQIAPHSVAFNTMANKSVFCYDWGLFFFD